jgi:hypothetical protein
MNITTKIAVFVVLILPSIGSVLIGLWSYAIGYDVLPNMIGTLLGLAISNTAVHIVANKLSQQYYK